MAVRLDSAAAQEGHADVAALLLDCLPCGAMDQPRVPPTRSPPLARRPDRTPPPPASMF